MKRFLEGPGLIALVHGLGVLPAAWLLEAWLGRQLGPDPLLVLEDTTGLTALSLLVLTLAVSPLARLLRVACIARARLPLGLYTAGYVLLHLLILVGLDFGFNLPLFLASYGSTLLFWSGFLTLLILFALAVTSLRSWKVRLGSRWKHLHRLIYLAAVLDLAHYFLAVKGSLLTFSGNLARPLLYTLAILFLLGLRLVPSMRMAPKNT